MSLETIKLDVSDGDTLTCCGCDEEYSAEDVKDLVAGWAKLLPWIMAHPARQPEEANHV